MSARAWVRHWGVPMLLVAATVAAIVLFRDEFTLGALQERRGDLSEAVDAHPAAMGLAFVGVYAATVALSIPGAALLSVAGGLLFGVALGASLAVVGATVGATVIFLIVRWSLAETVARRAGPNVRRVERALGENAFHAVFSLRLIPVLPLSVVNVASALAGMRLAPFVLGTFLGIIPGGIAFAAFGDGLGEAFDEGRPVSLGDALSAKIVGGLVALATLSLLPVALRVRGRRRGSGG